MITTKGTVISLVILGVLILCTLFLFTCTVSAAPTIYYKASTDTFYVNSTVNENLSGWLYDYDIAHGLSVIYAFDDVMTTGSRIILRNPSMTTPMYVNDTMILYSIWHQPTATTDYWMYIWDNVRVRFDNITIHYHNLDTTKWNNFIRWNDTSYSSLSWLNLTDCTIRVCTTNTHATAPYDRMGSASVTFPGDFNLVAKRTEFMNLLLYRASVWFYDVTLSQSPVYSTFAALDISTDSYGIYSHDSLYLFSGGGTQIMYNIVGKNIGSYFLYTTGSNSYLQFRNCYTDGSYTLYQASGTNSKLEVQYGFQFRVVDENNMNVSDVNVTIRSYNTSGDYAIHYLSTDSSGLIPLTFVNYSSKETGVSQGYFTQNISISKDGYNNEYVDFLVDKNTLLVMPFILTSEDNYLFMSGISFELETMLLMLWFYVSFLLVKSKKMTMLIPLSLVYVGLSFMMYTNYSMFNNFYFLLISFCIFVAFFVNILGERKNGP